MMFAKKKENKDKDYGGAQERMAKDNINFESPYTYKKQGEQDYVTEKKISLMQNLESKKYMRNRADQESKVPPQEQSRPMQELDQNTIMQESQLDNGRSRMADLKRKLEYFNKGKEAKDSAG